MKKSLVLMAMAGVALASCVNDVADVAQNQEQKKVKITFDSPVVYDNNAGSRATVFGEIGPNKVGGNTYTYPGEESFKIFAVQYKGDYPGWSAGKAVEFNGDDLVYDSQVDGWAPKKDGRYYYWPDGEKMAFAAVSPADLTVEGQTGVNVGVEPQYTAAGLKIENFRVMPESAKQYDLMFSRRIVDQTPEKMNHGADAYSGIPIEFQHALSSIRFSVQNTSTAEVIITKIELWGVKDIGTFTEIIDPDNGTYIRGEGGNVTAGWSGQKASSEGLVYHAFNGSIKAPYEAQYISVLLDTTHQGYQSYNTGTFHQLLLLPQAIGENIKAYVEYTIDGVLNTKTVDLKDALKIATAGADDVTGDKLTAWEMGYRYTYRLWYSENSADKDRIYFAPSSEGWRDAGAYRIEL